MKIYAIIVAAGKGLRMQKDQKKQFIPINNYPILYWSILPFWKNKNISKVIVSLPQEDFSYHKDYLNKLFPEIECVIGGEKRIDSVYAGLSACPDNTDYVAIHDGVRPFIKTWEIDNLIKKAIQHKAVVPISLVKNTIKKISLTEKKIVCTIDRNSLANVFTPQIFAYSLIFEHLKKALQEDKEFTDDASILEYYHKDVYYELSSDENIKITTPTDLKLAEILLKDYENYNN